MIRPNKYIKPKNFAQQGIRVFSVFLIFLTFISINSFAQINNQPLETTFEYDSTKKVSFRLNTLNFVKNNEYFNDMMDGFTLFGYFANPKVAFRPANSVLIEAGAFVKKEFGTKGFEAIEPTFTVKFRRKKYDFIFGNLEGNISHSMIEPLMNFESVISDPLEHGIQIKKNQTEFGDFFDIWLDWQKSTIAGKENQENILFGLNWKQKPLEISQIKVNFPVQMTAFHQGGQNIISRLPVKTFLNTSIGLNLKHRFQKTALFFENSLVNSFDGKNTGKAFYSNLKFQTKSLQMILTYWHSNNFVSPMGGDLFQSVSRKFGNENYVEKRRNLFIFRVIKDWKIIEGLNLSFRFEPVYDLKTKKLEHSEGLYLKYNLSY